MRIRILFLLCVVSLAMVSSPEAKNRAKSWEFGVGLSHIDGDPDIPIDNAVGPTIHAGYNITEKLEAEFFLSTASTTHGDVPVLTNIILDRITVPRCRANLEPTAVDPECFNGDVNAVGISFEDDADFLRTFVQVTGNFLTDRESSTVPYVSGGLGVINETREDFPYVASYRTTAPDDTLCPDGTEGSDSDSNRETCTYLQSGNSPERFDSSFLLTLAAGARTFFNDWFGVRYEGRYLRHDSFVEGQNEWIVTVGATFVIGGEK